MQSSKIGLCNNVTVCKNADNKIEVEVSILDDFICPECGQNLVVKTNEKNFVLRKPILVSILAVLFVILLVYLIYHFTKNKTKDFNLEPSATRNEQVELENEKNNLAENKSNYISQETNVESNVDEKINEDLDPKDEHNKTHLKNLLIAENNRDIDAILSSYSNKLEKHWNLIYPTKERLKRLYESRWKRQSQSLNYVKKIDRIDENTYELYIDYTYTNKKTGTENTVSSIIEIKFDSDGKIIYVNGNEE